MQHLFLTSSIGTSGVGASIRQRLGHSRLLRTAFITTPLEPPSEQEDLSWVDADRRGLADNNFVAFDYTITDKTLAQIKSDLKGIEVLYISGGNTNYLLQESQKSGFIGFVQEFVQSGKLYISTSAGSIIAGPVIPPYLWGDQVGAQNLSDYTGYNLVNFTVVPHWGSTWFKDLYLNERMGEVFTESQPPLILLNDHEYIEVQGEIHRIIDARQTL